MKVEITPYTLNAAGAKVFGTPVSLTGESPAEQVSEYNLNGSNEVEIVKPIDSRSVWPIPRGNQQNTLTFSIWRTHASAGAAAYFVLAHTIALRGGGRVTLTFVEDNGAVIGRLFLNVSAVNAYRAHFSGVSTNYNYTIVAGAAALDAA